MITPEQRALLQRAEIRRWRTQLGIAGAEAIEDGEALTPEEQEAADRERQALMRFVQEISPMVNQAVQAFTQFFQFYVDACRPIVKHLNAEFSKPEWQEYAARLDAQDAYNARMAARAQ